MIDFSQLVNRHQTRPCLKCKFVRWETMENSYTPYYCTLQDRYTRSHETCAKWELKPKNDGRP